MAKKKSPRAPQAEGERGKLDFNALHLIESKSNRGTLKPNELPGKASQNISLSIGYHEDEKTLVGTSITLTLDLRYDRADDTEPTVSILAHFLATFKIIEAFTSKKYLEDYLEHLSIRTVWPYWREFVQSMTIRMGLPAFPVSVIIVPELLAKLNQEKKQEAERD